MTSVALLIAVAAITPGPNNLFVMEAATHSGVRGAVASIAAVVSGGLVMLALVIGGGGAMLAAVPEMRTLIAIAGTSYLAWLGAGLMRQRAATEPSNDRSQLRAAGLFAFQFVNPKGWVMVLTVFAAVSGHDHLASVGLSLALLYTVIPAICLSLWSALGLWLTRWLRRPRNRALFDRTMGLLLIGSALSLVIEVFLHRTTP